MAYQEEPLSPAPSPSSPSAWKPWGLVDIALAIGAVILTTMLLAVPAALLGAGEGDQGGTAVLLGFGFGQEVLLAAVALFFTVRRHRTPWSALGFRLPQRGALWVPAAVFLGSVFIMFTYLGILNAVGYTDVQGNVPEEVFDSLPLAVMAGFLLLGFAPVMEELFFRGFIFGGLLGRWRFLWAALGSGFIFALAHINPVIYLPIVGIGVLFAWSYAYSGSLLTSIASHLAYNSFIYGLAVSGVAR